MKRSIALSVALTSALSVPLTVLLLTHEAQPTQVMEDGGSGLWLVVALAGVALAANTVALFLGLTEGNRWVTAPFLTPIPAVRAGLVSMNVDVEDLLELVSVAAPDERTIMSLRGLSGAGWAPVLGLLAVSGSLGASAVAFTVASALQRRYALHAGLAAVVAAFAWAQAHRLALWVHALDLLIAPEGPLQRSSIHDRSCARSSAWASPCASSPSPCASGAGQPP